MWLLILMTPAVSILGNNGSWEQVLGIWKFMIPTYIIYVAGFYLNYFFWVPRFFLNKKILKYFLALFVSYVVLVEISRLVAELFWPDVPKQSIGGTFLSALTFHGIINMLLVLAGIAFRSGERTAQLELEMAHKEQERVAGELDRLKSQLNPHFLFNTLNNISSLVAFDTDAAQTSISRLSEMLRYVLYESTDTTVSMQREQEFLTNYIDLMALRYGDTLNLDVNFPESSNRQIAPMLFISLVENAFKYGASSRHFSRIKVHLHDDAQYLHFVVENTLLTPEEQNTEKKGGVGLENLKKRLELLYPGRYRFDSSEVNGIHKAELYIYIIRNK